jgi:hypothetical protein
MKVVPRYTSRKIVPRNFLNSKFYLIKRITLISVKTVSCSQSQILLSVRPGSHTNCMRGAELRTGNTRTLAVRIHNFRRGADLRTGGTRILASRIRGHSALLRLAYRFESEKLLIPANQVVHFSIGKINILKIVAFLRAI